VHFTEPLKASKLLAERYLHTCTCAPVHNPFWRSQTLTKHRRRKLFPILEMLIVNEISHPKLKCGHDTAHVLKVSPRNIYFARYSLEANSFTMPVHTAYLFIQHTCQIHLTCPFALLFIHISCPIHLTCLFTFPSIHLTCQFTSPVQSPYLSMFIHLTCLFTLPVISPYQSVHLPVNSPYLSNNLFYLITLPLHSPYLFIYLKCPNNLLPVRSPYLSIHLTFSCTLPVH